MKKAVQYALLLITGPLFFLKVGYAQSATLTPQPPSFMQTVFFVEGVPKAASANSHYADVEGNPYFHNGWAAGEAVLSDGKAYKNLLLKYDEVEGMVIFKYALTDSAMAFAVPAVEFKFTYVADSKVQNAHFANGFEPTGDATKTTFYQILAQGSTMLLKRTEKKILKHSDYGSSEIQRTIETTSNYYITKGKQPIHINNSEKAVVYALSDKADALKKYVAENNLNLKNDDDFTRLINFYNAR